MIPKTCVLDKGCLVHHFVNMAVDEGVMGRAAFTAPTNKFNGARQLSCLSVQTPIKEPQEEMVANRLQKTAVARQDPNVSGR